MPGAREIKGLKVQCCNAKQGCQWTGTVNTADEHSLSCLFVRVSCPNNCESDIEKLDLLKKDLSSHLESVCPKRDHKCRYCGKKGTFYSITEEHDKICDKKMMPCFNSGCIHFMERKLILEHARNECPYTEVACPFENIGCTAKMRRKNVKEHKKEARDKHIDLALEAASMHESHQRTLLEGQAIVFKLSEFSNKKERNERFFSTPFYTHPEGYLVAIRVDCNGDGVGKGTHLSVFTKLLHGNNDRLLQWPFRGVVKYELLNQASDSRHFCKVSTFNSGIKMHINELWGHPKFFPHSHLLHDPIKHTQYLMDDALYFRVTVKVDYKSWITCMDKVSLSFYPCSSDIVLKCREPMVFKVTGYESKKENNIQFYSDPFYVAADGYRMCIEVDINGDGVGKGTHVSVYAKILDGIHDDLLKWPFRGAVTFTLLNQLCDDKHYSWTLEYKDTDNAGVGSSWGKPRFFSHANLQHDPVKETQYLMDDQLFIRVQVEASQLKLWLVCTRHR